MSVAAYSYEYEATSIMSDAQFDAMCLEVDPSVSTGNRRLDTFFRKKFSPHTGQWVHAHPEKHKLKHIFEKHHCG